MQLHRARLSRHRTAQRAIGSSLRAKRRLSCPHHDETADQNVVLRFGDPATADVAKRGIAGLIQVVGVDHADSSAIAVAGVQAATSIRAAQLTTEKTEAQALKTKEDAKQAAIKDPIMISGDYEETCMKMSRAKNLLGWAPLARPGTVPSGT